MNQSINSILDSDLKNKNKTASMETAFIDGEKYYKIINNEAMRPFFMSIVSDSNHWMFISSNGGLSAGRKNSEFALFPYYTDDKITESADITGSKTIFQITHDGQLVVWEPFSDRYTDQYVITRNLYKNFYGNKIIFEEINHDLQLTFRYHWNSSNKYGFVKKSEIHNHSDKEYKISILDGLQNIMPYGVNTDLQATTSNLVDAYKRSELHEDSGLGIFATCEAVLYSTRGRLCDVCWQLMPGHHVSTHDTLYQIYQVPTQQGDDSYNIEL